MGAWHCSHTFVASLFQPFQRPVDLLKEMAVVVFSPVLECPLQLQLRPVRQVFLIVSRSGNGTVRCPLSLQVSQNFISLFLKPCP